MKVNMDEAAVQRLLHSPEVQEEMERRCELGVAFAKNDCPVETGRARDSIRKERQPDGNWKILGGGINGVDYFEYIEYGTRDTETHHPLLHAAEAVKEG